MAISTDFNKFTANLAYKYRTVKLKLYTTIEDIKFNKYCRDNNIIPNYIHVPIKNKSPSAQAAKHIAEKTWLNKEIDFLYNKKFQIGSQLLKLHLEIAHKLHFIEVEDLITNIDTWIETKVQEKRSILTKKLDKLTNTKTTTHNGKFSNHEFYPRIVNNTQIQFDSQETELLNKGLKHCIPQNNYTNLLIDLESTIQTLPKESQNETRILAHSKVVKHINKPRNLRKTSNRDHTTLKQIKQKLTTANASVTKADKGNTLVVIDNDEQKQKILNFIDVNNIKKLGKDPTLKYHEQIRKAINKSKVLTDNQKYQSRTIKPNAPKLRGLPKLHKPEQPIRPLVNFINSPAYKISKILDKIIRTEIKLINDRSIKNTTDLIEKIKNIPAPETHTLASFDIKDLYTNIPIDETLEILKQNLINQQLRDTTFIEDLIQLTKIVLQQNYFEFNDEYYSQNTGLAMGSPLSALIAEIFLNNIENEYILNDNKNKQASKIIQYHRYADDIFCLFHGNKRQIEVLSKHINAIHPNLKFTTEIEENNSINYLDLTITKHNNKFNFKIYRKPTTTDQVIHSTSNHPISHKLAAFHSMVHRLLTIPLSKEDYANEHNIIKQIAFNNGYNPNLINKLIWKKKQNQNKEEDNIRKNFIVTTYHGKINNTIQKIFTNKEQKIAYRSTNNISQILNKTVNRNQNPYSNTGIYKLKCGSCPKFYIGQTGRSFSQRYKEHIPKKDQKNPTSFSQHIMDEIHSYSTIDKSMDIIHKAPKSNRLDTLEHFHIYKASKETPSLILNDQKSFSANVIFDSLIKMQNNI